MISEPPHQKYWGGGGGLRPPGSEAYDYSYCANKAIAQQWTPIWAVTILFNPSLLSPDKTHLQYKRILC